MFGLNVFGAMGVMLYVSLLIVFILSVAVAGIKEIIQNGVREYWRGKLLLFEAVSKARQEDEETPVA